jgi:alpha-beta hydrolase superfamily lysophospholipase
MTFGYDARGFISPFKKAIRARVFIFGRMLLEALLEKRTSEDERHRPIILIGHSLGGIVVKSVCYSTSMTGSV